MLFLVFDSQDKLYYYTESWPMARSALDLLIQKEDGCPRLEVIECTDYTVE